MTWSRWAYLNTNLDLSYQMLILSIFKNTNLEEIDLWRLEMLFGHKLLSMHRKQLLNTGTL
jgi:hypothetical protein